MASTAKTQRAYYQRRMARRLVEFGLNNAVCAVCGTTEDVQFDHSNPQTRKADISQMLRTATDDDLAEELAKGITALCRSHHLAKKSIYRYEGRLWVLSDNAHKNEITRKGEWVSWTVEPIEQVESRLRLMERILQTKARLAIYEAQYA